MSNPARTFCLAPLLLTLVAGCDPDTDNRGDSDASAQDELRTLTSFTLDNYYNNPKSGMRLNTNNLGEWPFSEFLLDGSMHHHVTLLDVTTGSFGPNRPQWEIDDVPPNERIERINGLLDLRVNAEHMLFGTTQAGMVLQHGDFHNSIWAVQLDPEFIQELDAAGIHHDGNGRVELLLEVDWVMPEAIEFDPWMMDEDEDERSLSQLGGVPIYTFSYMQNDELVSTCSTQTLVNQISNAAVLYRDLSVEDYDARINTQADILQIACIDGAVGKVAAKWAYWPNSMDPSAVSPGDHRVEFELGVRVVRADYCGDGVSWTLPGQQIDVFDNYSHTLAASTPNDTALFRPQIEAVWGDGGALCVDVHRLAGQTPNCGIPACGGTNPSFGWLNQQPTDARFVTRNYRMFELNVP